MDTFKTLIKKCVGEAGIQFGKRIFYSNSGEPVEYGTHKLRYLVGSRPVRLEYLSSTDVTARNDARQIQFFLNSVMSGDFVLDIGGHHGQYAVLFASLAGSSGQVITFEPDHTASKVLSQNLALNPCAKNVKVESIALSDVSGTQAFFSCGGDSMSSLARSGLGTNSSKAIEQVVETQPLDQYLAANDLKFPQWVKLDTEGAEISILRGARQVLKSGAVFVCELHPYAWEEFGTSFDELLRIVHDCGRTIRYVDESLRIEDGAVYGSTIIS